jgi:hypothetical protein
MSISFSVRSQACDGLGAKKSPDGLPCLSARWTLATARSSRVGLWSVWLERATWSWRTCRHDILTSLQRWVTAHRVWQETTVLQVEKRAQACLNWDPFAAFAFGNIGSGSLRGAGPDARISVIDPMSIKLAPPSCMFIRKGNMSAESHGELSCHRAGSPTSTCVMNQCELGKALQVLGGRTAQCRVTPRGKCSTIVLRKRNVWPNCSSSRIGSRQSSLRKIASAHCFRWLDVGRATPPSIDGSRWHGIGRERLSDCFINLQCVHNTSFMANDPSMQHRLDRLD